MSPDMIYFMKVNAAILFFYAFYRLFFYNDTPRFHGIKSS